jgi:hypothetical protein
VIRESNQQTSLRVYTGAKNQQVLVHDRGDHISRMFTPLQPILQRGIASTLPSSSSTEARSLLLM